jgi:hypothetical protein
MVAGLFAEWLQKQQPGNQVGKLLATVRLGRMSQAQRAVPHARAPETHN